MTNRSKLAPFVLTRVVISVAEDRIMSGAVSRLSGLLGHFVPGAEQRVNFHTLSPTYFLPRAAAIEPEVCLGFLSIPVGVPRGVWLSANVRG